MSFEDALQIAVFDVDSTPFDDANAEAARGRTEKRARHCISVLTIAAPVPLGVRVETPRP